MKKFYKQIITGIFFSFLTVVALGQSVSVSGIVTDEGGEGLP
jgi:hypothetical protein